MASRLLERLDADIAREQSPYERECLKAQRAAAIARLGSLNEARFALAGLRTQSRRFRKSRLQAWVHLIDGLIDHFDTLGPLAREKFLASREQAEMAKDGPLQALASAWMAISDFNARRYDDMAQALLIALRHALPEDHGTHVRASLVRADASRHAGLMEQATRHYADAHRHAVAEGDTAMISAMLHNRVGFRVADSVMADVFGQPCSDGAQRTLIEVESTLNLDRGLGNDALKARLPIMRAELCTVLQRWSEGVALFNTYLDQVRSHGAPMLGATYLAHRAWCHWHLQDTTNALKDAEAAEQTLDLVIDADDQTITHQRLASLFERAEQPTRAAEHHRLALQALEAYKLDQARLAQVLHRLDEDEAQLRA